MLHHSFHDLMLKAILITAVVAVAAGCKPTKNDKIDSTTTETQVIDSVDETTATPPAPTTTPSPKKIILFIGDGMGVGALTAATYAKGELLEMEKMPHFSWMGNHEYEYLTTDSAASATAFSTGKKTHFEAVSVKPGTTDDTDDDTSTHLRSVLRAAEEAGMKTGLVALSRINHATPAAFAANRYIRNRYEEIALDQANSGVDVLLGAGSNYFDKRQDGKDLLKEMEDKGYTVAKSADEVRKATSTAKQLVGLMYEKDFPYVRSGQRAMSLKEMTKSAIEILDRDNDKGWFLMVEGSLIDWCEHDLNGLCTVAETLDFDEAVGVGREYVAQNEDAVMVVTADHETAGVSVLQPRIYDMYANVLGGPKDAAVLAAPSAGTLTVEPIPAIARIGDLTTTYAPDATPPTNAFGLVDLPDSRFTVSFSYLSVASRHLANDKEINKFSGAHTTTFVPLFAQGRGAEAVATVIDNADLGKVLVDFVDQKETTLPPPTPTSPPKNVILLIGDGMGINSVTAGYYGHGNIAMLSAPVKGLVSTNATDFVVNDSAATATALASGHRTRRGALGVVFEGEGVDQTIQPVESILERAEKTGRRTGLVSTVPLTHATPAAFYAHVPTRSASDIIADQFIDFAKRVDGSDGIDIAITGGARDFGPEKVSKLKGLGYTVLDALPSTPLKSKSIVFLGNYGLPSAEERQAAGAPSLAKLTTSALEVLTAPTDDDTQSEKGFFLMVEGGQIDWLLHGMNNTKALVDEVADFDDAVRTAVEFAEKDGNTLVVVTADHDHTMSIIDNHYAFKAKQNCLAAKRCGGSYDLPTIPVAKSGIAHGEGLQKPDSNDITPGFHLIYDWVVTVATGKNPTLVGPHSANFVPLFAWGPGAARFGAFKQQPDVGKLLFETTGW